jgi:CDP-diacylglycerol pyrophosphatase
MRRLILLLTAMALTLVVASGVTLAVNKIGTNGPDILRGTNSDVSSADILERITTTPPSPCACVFTGN